jgi:hypothetical protein
MVRRRGTRAEEAGSAVKLVLFTAILGGGLVAFA